MSRPLLLDLFCGAGGAAMGYHRAGFDVIGVDIEPQPHYPFPFFRGDALQVVDLHRFDAVHASPPCQAFTALQRAAKNAHAHPDLVGPTRELLRASGLPFVIENVPGAPLLDPVVYCGASVGLEVVRHRLFESNVQLSSPGCTHTPGGTTTGQYVAFRHSGRVAPGRIVPPRRTERDFRQAIGCEWMPLKAMRQAIPPAYTEHIGRQLLTVLR